MDYSWGGKRKDLLPMPAEESVGNEESWLSSPSLMENGKRITTVRYASERAGAPTEKQIIFLRRGRKEREKTR